MHRFDFRVRDYDGLTEAWVLVPGASPLQVGILDLSKENCPKAPCQNPLCRQSCREKVEAFIHEFQGAKDDKPMAELAGRSHVNKHNRRTGTKRRNRNRKHARRRMV